MEVGLAQVDTHNTDKAIGGVFEKREIRDRWNPSVWSVRCDMVQVRHDSNASNIEHLQRYETIRYSARSKPRSGALSRIRHVAPLVTISH